MATFLRANLSLHKGFSNPFARPSYLQPKLPPVGQTQGKLSRFSSFFFINLVGFGQREWSRRYDLSRIWMFPKIGGKPPIWMVELMENPMKMG